MRIASMIARIPLGAIFLVFGLNGFFHFIPMPLPSGLAGTFMGTVSASHYIDAVFALEVIAGVLLLINRYVPLALTILAAIIVNIFLYHAIMAPSGLPLALAVLILWLIVAVRHMGYFQSLFVQKTDG